jgi:hypothetical protein
MLYAYTFTTKDKDGCAKLVYQMRADGPLPHLDQDRAVWLQVDGTARKFEVAGIDLVVAPDMSDSVGIKVSVRENEDHTSTDVTAESLTWIGRPK